MRHVAGGRDGTGRPRAAWIRTLGTALVSFACASPRAVAPETRERALAELAPEPAGATASLSTSTRATPAVAPQRDSAPSADARSRSEATAAQGQPSASNARPNPEGGGGEPPARRKEALRIERGADELPLIVPVDELLVFGVRLKLGFLDSRVGRVTLSARVEPFRPSPLLLGDTSEHAGEKYTLTATAEGSYTLYELHNVITCVSLPQDWPHVVLRNLQSGTENRQRELLLGLKDGASLASYRSDRHCKGCQDRAHFLEPAWAWQDEHHCESCKRAEHRVWREAVSKAIPEGTLDMLNGILLARTLVREGQSRVRFMLIDKLELWEVTLSRGRRERREVQAGTFDLVEVRLSTRPPPGEKGREKDFEGLFGIHGTISIWMEAASGVPVLISGLVPAGPLDLDVEIELASYRGTSAEFRPR